MKIVFNWQSPVSQSAITIGNFDGVHLGHQTVLRKLNKIAEKGDTKLAMTFEPHPLAYLIPERKLFRLIDLRTKSEQLFKAGIEQVNVMGFNNQLASMEANDFINHLVTKLKMKKLVVGKDFRFGHKRVGNTEFLKQKASEYDFELSICEDHKELDTRVSSKLLRQVIKENDFVKASKLLGRPYQITGRVVDGEKLGRTLGFPTANIKFRGTLALHGIYASFAYLDGEKWPAALSVGNRPTINKDDLTIEANLIGFTGNAYSQLLSIEPVQFMRKEIKFEDLDALKKAMAEDIKNCQEVLLAS